VGAATYDEIATWYEEEFLGSRSADVTGGIGGALAALLGRGHGLCGDVGCGTGASAALLGELGWTPLGIDVSAGMLRYARGRLPVARADATRLPLRDRSLPVATSIMVHTDTPVYPEVLRAIARALVPGGVFVHVGVHPCFCGGFADWTDRDAIVVRPGYLDSYWTKASYTTAGVRARIGAEHRPLPELLRGFTEAGFTLEAFAEGGAPTPIVLGIRARKPR
jgi:ubiquinone/menaquinone biosynthesis C-methylase UbiE